MDNCDCEVIHEEIVKKVQENLDTSEMYEDLSSLFKIFGDQTRVKILHALAQHEMCVCDLAVLLNLTKSAISHQLKSLRLAKLVKYHKDAQIVYYSLADDHVKKIINMGMEHLKE